MPSCREARPQLSTAPARIQSCAAPSGERQACTSPSTKKYYCANLLAKKGGEPDVRAPPPRNSNITF